MKKKWPFLYVIVLIKIFPACKQPVNIDEEILRYNQRLDSVAGARIDSAYKKIKDDCDTARLYRLPVLIDSLLKTSAP
ncbi:hypothetical protein [Foetidibacter luteolus]|uniref:hypothetical protein n=1 Tax=Foetidibacter luteolus TaxID=2608880 RepID=UPI00129BB3C9|nr:hypothetical protein [Foetidibacter luteolus]